MNINLNPLEEYVNKIKGNTNFLSRLISPKISIPIFAVFVMVVGLIVMFR